MYTSLAHKVLPPGRDRWCRRGWCPVGVGGLHAGGHGGFDGVWDTWGTHKTQDVMFYRSGERTVRDYRMVRFFLCFVRFPHLSAVVCTDS